MVRSFVQVWPPLFENHRGAFVVLDDQPPENDVMTACCGLLGLRATLGSVPPVVSVVAKLATVLFTAGSTTNGVELESPCTGGAPIVLATWVSGTKATAPSESRTRLNVRTSSPLFFCDRGRSPAWTVRRSSYGVNQR
jgi:hypothetical protein